MYQEDWSEGPSGVWEDVVISAKLTVRVSTTGNYYTIMNNKLRLTT